jgi:hypothetical protein
MLTAVKTHFISKQTINFCCSVLPFNGTSSEEQKKDFALLLDTGTPNVKETALELDSYLVF